MSQRDQLKPLKAERSTGERGKEWRTERKMREMGNVRLNGSQITKNRLLFERHGKQGLSLTDKHSSPCREENIVIKTITNSLNQHSNRFSFWVNQKVRRTNRKSLFLSFSHIHNRGNKVLICFKAVLIRWQLLGFPTSPVFNLPPKCMLSLSLLTNAIVFCKMGISSKNLVLM